MNKEIEEIWDRTIGIEGISTGYPRFVEELSSLLQPTEAVKHDCEILVNTLIGTHNAEKEEIEKKVAQQIYDWLENEWYGRSELQTRIKLTYLAERGKK
jgi:hypothetical protein